MKKKVDVFCAGAFVINGAPFAGKCLNVILPVEDIRMCLLNKAFVWELTPEGKRIPLDFTNYRLDNGGVVDDKIISSTDSRFKNTDITHVKVNTKEDGTREIVKETKVVVEKVEREKPKIFKEEKVPVVEKKEETKKEDVKVVAEMDVTAKIEEEKKEEVKEEKKFDYKNNKHNKK